MSTSLEVLGIDDESATNLGRGAAASGENAVAVGAAQGSSDDSTVGLAVASGDKAIAIGYGAEATGDGAVQIGEGTNADDDTIQFQETKIPTETAFNNLVNFLNAGLLQLGGLAISATPEEFKTATDVIVNINGIQVTSSADADIPFTAAHVVTALKHGIILIQVDGAGAVSSKVPAATQAYDTAALALAALPDADADNVAIGYITIEADAGDWTAITDDLTDGSDLTAATFVDADLSAIATI